MDEIMQRENEVDLSPRKGSTLSGLEGKAAKEIKDRGGRTKRVWGCESKERVCQGEGGITKVSSRVG